MTNGSGDQLRSEVLALHDIVVGDVAFFKSQQWRVTNYALLLDAAAIAVVRALPDPSDLEHLVLCLLGAAGLIAGLVVINELEASIRQGRDRMAHLRLLLSKEVLLALAAGGSESDPHRDGSEKSSLAWLFRSAMVVAFFKRC